MTKYKLVFFSLKNFLYRTIIWFYAKSYYWQLLKYIEPEIKFIIHCRVGSKKILSATE